MINKTIFMRLILFFAALSLLLKVQSQTIVNAYAKVNSISSGNILSVNNVNETNHTFNNGEKVIIMQMQDNVIGANTANNATFGDVGSIGMAGVYEIATIASTAPNPGTPNVITLTAPLANAFNTSANSSVQIITFRKLGVNFTTTSSITAPVWNGNVGGVVAIEVDNELTLNHSITVDAIGFRGGAISTSAGGGCQPTIYRTNATTQGYKGEGIYKSTDANYVNGRAKLLNGGGGGNEHNGGGGGGGNYSAGGEGGRGWNCGSNSGGLGGLSLSTYINLYRVYMGGGGGGGQQNNNVATPGARGGGIIILKAPTVETNGVCGSPIRISANGGTSANSGNDGGGGGGAGGTVILDVSSFDFNAACPVSISASGGSGGTVNNSDTHGGGGGGGQGALIFSTIVPTVNTTINTLVGNGGANSTPATTFAQTGIGPNNAAILVNLVTLPVELLSFNAIKNGDKVDAFWTTVSELNNDYFTLERSKDGVSFETVVTIDGAGNSNYILNYTETDFSPYDGISYYRLKQTDFNGSSSYSQIVSVNYIFNEDNLIVYPNPSDGTTINIALKNRENKEILVVLRDFVGRKYYSKVIISLNETEIIGIDLEQKLASGAYIITVSSNNKLYSKKLIIK
jgi:hypothetical protein